MQTHGVEDRLQQVRALDHRIVILEAGAKAGSQRNARHFLAGEAVAHDQVVGKHGAGIDRLGQAEQLEHAEHVGPELDAGAGFAKIRGRLEHVHAMPLARERQRGSQAADAAAGDEYGQFRFRHVAPPFGAAIISGPRARPQRTVSMYSRSIRACAPGARAGPG